MKKNTILLAVLFIPIITYSQALLDDGITAAYWGNSGEMDSIHDYSSGVTIDLGQAPSFAVALFDTTAPTPIIPANNNFVVLNQSSLIGLLVSQTYSTSLDTLYQSIIGGLPASPDSLYVEILWWLEASNGLSGKIKVKCTSSKLSVWSVTFPLMTIPPIGGNPANDYLAIPLFTGILVPNPISLPNGYRGELSNPYSALDSTIGAATGAQYPARMTMQYETYYDVSGGLYFQTTDTSGRFKEFIAKGDSANTKLRLGVTETRENCHIPSPNFWEIPNRAIIKAFKGDWVDATMIYRDWAIQQFWCDRGPMYSRKMPHDSINVAITVESDFFETNYPGKQLPAVDSILALLGDKMAPIIHLRSWKFQTPYFGSDVVANWKPFMDAAKISGYIILPYTNTNHWTVGLGDDNDSTQVKSRAVNINGNPYYDATWWGQIMNPEDIAWRKKFYGIADTIFNVLGCTDIYMDYPPNVKLDWNPRHSAGGGDQWFQGFRSLGDSTVSIGESVNSDAIFIQEGRFEGQVDIYDGFIYPDWENVTTILAQGTEPIPVFEAVFGDYITTSSSAGYSLRDPANTNYDKMKYLYAYSLVNGKFFGFAADTVFLSPNTPTANEIEIVKYVGDLVRLRVNAHRWFVYGAWQRPPSINSPLVNINFPDIGMTLSRPAVESGAMRLNNEALLLFANHTELPQTINADITVSDYSNFNSRWLVTKDTVTYMDEVGANINEILTLQPRETIGWLLLDSMTISLNEFVDDDVKFHVFPNPATNELHVEVENDDQKEFTLKLVTILGHEIYKTTFSHIQLIRLENAIARGTYFCVIENTENEILFTKKIEIH